MDKFQVYEDISRRTDGDIYIGVVGPVRTGKSTFIKKFMDTLVLPNISSEVKRERANDEMPQSAAGRTIMTTEPKFIPNEAVRVTLSDNASFNVRLIDCVGYIVPTALGYIEDEMPRMVNTPWLDREIPFDMAAEIGTKKVIVEHSTIGLMITTDGSFGEIPREDYVEAEERVVNELKAINKPFIILLNSTAPDSYSTQNLKVELEEKYHIPVMAINCLQLAEPDIKDIMERLLFEFPVQEIGINMPGWIAALDAQHWLRYSVYKNILDSAAQISKISHVRGAAQKMGDGEYVLAANLDQVDLGSGNAVISLQVEEGLFYKILGETTGLEVVDEESLIKLMIKLSSMQSQYERVSKALIDVNNFGYGIVTPSIDELRLEAPEIVKQGGRFGVRLRASAPSIHLARNERNKN